MGARLLGRGTKDAWNLARSLRLNNFIPWL